MLYAFFRHVLCIVTFFTIFYKPVVYSNVSHIVCFSGAFSELHIRLVISYRIVFITVIHFVLFPFLLSLTFWTQTIRVFARHEQYQITVYYHDTLALYPCFLASALLRCGLFELQLKNDKPLDYSLFFVIFCRVT